MVIALRTGKKIIFKLFFMNHRSNKDDKNGRVMIQNTGAAGYTYSLQAMADFRCKIIENQFHGIHLNLDGHEVWFKLIGTFNAYNLLAVYATAVLLGMEKTEVLTLLSRISLMVSSTFFSASGVCA